MIIIYISNHPDEYLSVALFHAEAGTKMAGIDAAVAGALAGLAAQIVTTPVCMYECS